LALLESLCKFVSLKSLVRFLLNKKSKEIIQLIKKNVDEIADEKETARIILKKYLSTPTKYNGLTVLMTARLNEHNEIADFLGENGAEVFDQKTGLVEKTAFLFDAIRKNNYSFVKEILDSKCN